MAENEQEQKIIISVEAKQAEANLKKLAVANKELAKEASAAGGSYKGLEDRQKAISKAQRDNISILKAMGHEYDSTTQSIKVASVELDTYESRLRAVNEAGASRSGDIAGSIGGIRGAASAVGLGAVADVPLGIAEAAADFGEFLPKLKVGLEATAASGTGLVSTVASLAAGALPAAGAGFGAIAVALAPIVLIAGAVAAGFAFVAGEMDKAQKAAVLLAEQERDAAQRKNQLVIAEGATTLELANQITELGLAADAAQQDIIDAQASYDAYVASRSNPLQAFGDAVGFFGDQEQVLADSITEAQNRFQGLVVDMSSLNEAIQNGETATNDLAAQERDLAEAREQDAKDSIAAQEAALRANEATQARIAQLAQQRADILANQAIAETNALQSEKLEKKFAQEDEKAELSQHLSALADIRADGAAKVKAIEEELAALPVELAEALADVNAKGTKELDKLNQEYFKSQIKATKDFAKESGRIVSDTAKAAKRLAEDLADNLADAARDNDVVAFLELQKDGQKELKRNAEDAAESEKRRAEDFAQQQEEQRNAFQQRQAEILANLAEERAQVLQSFMEKRAQLELERQQVLANTQSAIAAENARFAQKQAQDAQAAARDKERMALKQAQEDSALKRQLAAIDQKTNAELQGLSRVAAAAASLGSSKSTKSGLGGGVGGGLGFSGLNKNNKSGFSKGSAGNNTVIVNATVGDVATGNQVTNAINQNNQAFMSAILKGVSGAQGG